MDPAEQLKVLEAAQGNPAKLALALVDLGFPDEPESRRTALKAALQAAAIPHWCDAEILAAVLAIPPEESASLFPSLRSLRVVEPFSARGENAVNVHDATRLALRRYLSAEEPDRFRLLSRSAAVYFESNKSQAGRIEWIYHLLCADPERGVASLQEMGGAWYRTARPEDRYAFAAALKELDDTHLIEGRGLIWARLAIGWTRFLRGEAAQLVEMASGIVTQAQALQDGRAESDANALLADALGAQGRRTEAAAALRRSLAIGQRLIKKSPDVDLLMDAAVTHSKLGEVLRAQGKLKDARAEVQAAIEINQGLVKRDPDNRAWQRDLGVVQNRMGGILETLNDLPGALAACSAAEIIFARLDGQDPDNGEWQLGLADARVRKGGILQTQGEMDKARQAFDAALAGSRALAAKDPENADWQGELVVALNRMAGLLEAQSQLAEALALFYETLDICRRLVGRDGTNEDRWRELEVAHIRVAAVLKAQAKYADALAAFEAALTIGQRLAIHDPSNVDWQRDLSVAHNETGVVLQALGRKNEAQAHLDASSEIDRRLEQRTES